MLSRLLLVLAVSAARPAVPAAVPPADNIRAFIEQQLRAHDVPGASVAVIRNHRVAWSDGFGVTNTITRQRVEPDTVFPVASNGKPVTAWIAQRLASRNTLDLQRPVLAQSKGLLPDTPEHQKITPTHLLTHTSGLGNFVRDKKRRVSFAPGSQFAYSGAGFVVLQELMEQRSGKTLDALLREELPAMRHSWFGARPSPMRSVAPPHIDLGSALIPFTVAAAPVAALLLIIVMIARRSWRVPRRDVAIVVATAAIAVFAFLWNRAGSWMLAAWFSAVPLALFVPVLLARKVVVLAIVFVAAFFVRDQQIPLPSADLEANAASSLRSTAPDLAQFLLRLNGPMTEPRQRIDAASSWGLGIGVESHARGRDLWHWGSNPGAKSLMIYCPETGEGVVVLTNGSKGSEPMRNIAAHVLGRKGCWRAGCE